MQACSDLVEEKERMVEVQEEARKKLARDLHDGPTQSVAAMAMRVNLARRMLAKDANSAADELVKIEELAHRTTKEIRHMLFTLRPLILESQGLTAALEAMAEKMHETFSQGVTIAVDERLLEDLEMGKQGVIFTSLKRLLTTPQTCECPAYLVRLYHMSRHRVLEIEDDGWDFNVEAVNKNYDKRELGMVNCANAPNWPWSAKYPIPLGKALAYKVYIPSLEKLLIVCITRNVIIILN